ncbi:beta-2 adrenergic receptor-like [Orbicella faveolata]|uniref:beta-2 adrenergic receptor-like n=1 Tax=Orbicella faveolata TaxID=48498 RepID=UPI0009E58EFB|nr:beta-2 adrenergic receptor-like [Orbicella faveolata]
MMKNTLLGKALLYQPSSTEYENLRSWYIVNCVFNAFLTITAIIFNSVTIQALRKTSSLPKPLRALLLSLAISDLGVGLLGEPFYVGLLVKWLQRDNSTDAASTAFLFTLYLFSAASFSGVMALSGDRFLAVHLHLRYQELVTHKRVVVVVISIWLFSALFSLFCLRVSTDISQALVPIIGVVCLVFSAVLYYKIYLAVRRHRNQIHALQVQQVAQNGEMANAARLRKSAVESVDEAEDFTIATQVLDEFSCALMCSSTIVCHYALFDKDSKKCSFVKATENLNRKDDAEPESEKILLEKVGNDERKCECNAFDTSLGF